jgi:hypothetical protein
MGMFIMAIARGLSACTTSGVKADCVQTKKFDCAIAALRITSAGCLDLLKKKQPPETNERKRRRFSLSGPPREIRKAPDPLLAIFENTATSPTGTMTTSSEGPFSHLLSRSTASRNSSRKSGRADSTRFQFGMSAPPSGSAMYSRAAARIPFTKVVTASSS